MFVTHPRTLPLFLPPYVRLAKAEASLIMMMCAWRGDTAGWVTVVRLGAIVFFLNVFYQFKGGLFGKCAPIERPSHSFPPALYCVYKPNYAINLLIFFILDYIRERNRTYLLGWAPQEGNRTCGKDRRRKNKHMMIRNITKQQQGEYFHNRASF